MALEREKNRLVREKCQSILTALLKDEDNKYCVDCDAKSPRWASWNLGIFLCIRCAGIHRNLGVHISKVKSVNLDTWTPQQVACIQQMGNSRARAVYEANLQDNFRRPQTDSSLEQFVRAKYEAKKYIAKEWIPPAMPNPSWDLEIEKQLKKKKEKKSVSGSVEFAAPVKKNGNTKGEGVSPKPLPKAPGGRNNSPNQQKRPSNSLSKSTVVEKENSGSAMVDLLGLDTPSTTNGTVDNDADIFGEFLTAPVTSTPNSVATSPDTNKEAHADESNFFNQKAPDVAADKLSKDSILALYNQSPSLSQPHPQTQAVYGGGGMYMGSSGMGVSPQQQGLGSVSQQQVLGSVPQQQNMIYQQVQGGIHPAYYPQAVPASGMYTSAMPPASMQLSAANPFAQMQAQMGNMSIATPVQSQQQMGKQLLQGGYMSNAGLGAAPPQATTLSTNLWQ